MSDEVIDECYDYLKYKRKPRHISELYNNFFGSYITFNEKDLFKEIKKDSRFEIIGDPKYLHSAGIKRKR